MLCEHCGKREAVVHITETINKNSAEVHLCDVCAQGKGFASSQPFALADLLAGLMDEAEIDLKKKKGLVTCPGCGMAFEDFKRIGRFGCAQCYETFKESIYPLLEKIHGAVKHTGKMPRKMPIVVKKESEIQQFQEKLKKAVEKEEFEEAAVIRDKIKELEKKKDRA